MSGFLVYMSVVLVLCGVLVLYLCPRLGQSNILVYISICSLLGAFTVSSVKGLAIAIDTGKCQLTSSRSHPLSNINTHSASYLWLSCILGNVRCHLFPACPVLYDVSVLANPLTWILLLTLIVSVVTQVSSSSHPDAVMM